MAARCPHYRNECRDEESKTCFYVKDTTSSAISNLRRLENMVRDAGYDPELQEQIDSLRKFLVDSKIRF